MTSTYETETADAARDAIAFVIAIHRDDSEAVAAIFNNADPFDLSHMIARYFLDFMEAMAASSGSDHLKPRKQLRAQVQAEVRGFLAHLQAEQRKSA